MEKIDPEKVSPSDLSLQIYYLEDLIKEKDGFIANKERQIAQLKEKISHLNNKKVVEIEIYDALKSEYDSNVVKYEQLFAKYDSIRTNEKSSLQQIEKLNLIIEDKENSLNQLKKVKEDIKIIKNENLILANEVSNLNQKCTTLEEENANLAENNKILENQLQEMNSLLPKKTNDSFNYSVASFDLSNISVPEFENVAGIQIDFLKSEKEELKTQNEVLKEKVVKLESKQQNLVTENEAKDCQIDDLKNCNDSLKSLVMEKDALYEEQLTKFNQLQNNFDQLSCLKEELDKDLSTKSIQLGQLNNQINQLSSEVMSLQNNIHLCENEKGQLRTLNEQQEQVISGFKQELATINSVIAQKDVLIRDLQAQIKEDCLIKQKLEQISLEKSLQIDEFAKKVNELENEQFQLCDKIKTLQTEIDKSEQVKKDLEDVVSELERSEHSLKCNNEEQSVQLGQLRNQICQLSSEIISLKTIIQQCESEQSQLKTVNEHQQQVISSLKKELAVTNEDIVQKELLIRDLRAKNEEYGLIKQTSLEQSLQIDEFAKKVKKLENDQFKLCDTIKTLQTEINKSEQVKKDLEGVVSELERAKHSLKCSNEEQSVQLGQLGNQISQLSSEIASLKINIQQCESEQSQLTTVNEQQQQMISGLKKELTVTNENIVQKELLIRDLQAKNEEYGLIKHKFEQTSLEQSLQIGEFAKKVKELENEQVQLCDKIKTLQTEIDKSEQVKKNLEDEVSELERTKHSLKCSNEEQSVQLGQLHNQVNQLSSEVTSLQTNIRLCESEKGQLRTLNEQQEQVISGFKQELATINSVVVQKEMSIQDLQAKNEEYCLIKQKLEQITLEQSVKIDECTKIVQEFEHEQLQLIDKIKMLQTEIDESQQKRKILEDSLSQLECDNGNLKSVNDEQSVQFNLLLQSKEEELAQSICFNEKKLTSLEQKTKEQLDAKDALIGQLNDQIDVLKSNSCQLTACNESLSTNVADLTLQIEKEKTVNRNLTDSIEKLTHNLTELKNRCEDLKTCNSQLVIERERLCKENNDKQVCFDEINLKIKSCEFENSNLLSQNKDLACQVKEYGDQMGQLKEDNVRLLTQLKESELKHEKEMKQLYASTNELSHAMHSKQFKIEELNKLIEKNKLQITSFQADLNDKSDEIVKYKTLYENLREETKHVGKNQELEKELTSLKNEIRKRDMKIRRIENELQTEQVSFDMERKTKERLLKENSALEEENRMLKKQLKSDEKASSSLTSERNLGDAERSNQSDVKSEPMDSSSSSSSQPSLPLAVGSYFAIADEEGQFMDPRHIDSSKLFKQPEAKGDRIKTLIYRNSLSKPHLRTAYPVEMQDTSYDENSFRSGSLLSISSSASKSKVSRFASSVENIPNKIFRSSKKEDTKSTLKSLTPSKIIRKVMSKQKSWSPHLNNKK